jgi:hypothetical protein
MAWGVQDCRRDYNNGSFGSESQFVELPLFSLFGLTEVVSDIMPKHL